MNVHPDVAFFVVEIHSFINNVTVYNNDKHVNGTNVGLVQMINGSHSYTFDITTEPNLTTNVLFGIVAYGEGGKILFGFHLGQLLIQLFSFSPRARWLQHDFRLRNISLSSNNLHKRINNRR